MNNPKPRVYTSYGQQKNGNSYKIYTSSRGANGNNKGCGMCGGKNLPQK